MQGESNQFQLLELNHKYKSKESLHIVRLGQLVQLLWILLLVLWALHALGHCETNHSEKHRRRPKTVEMSCKYWKHHFLQFLMSLPNVAPRHSHMNVVIQQKLFQCFTIREFEHISDFEVWPISKSCFSMPILHSVYSLGAKLLHQIISEGCGGG